MHAQIVADTLRLPYEAVEVSEADTDRVPDSGPTVASRTCMIVGRLLQRAAREMRERLDGESPAAYFRKHGSFVVTAEYERPPGLQWDDDRYRGDAYGSYGWGCNVVELEVDRATWEVSPTKVTAVVEIGKAIHPDHGGRPGRRRHRAGPRLRAARRGGDARRANGKRDS